jgi:hypothetical protein
MRKLLVSFAAAGSMLAVATPAAAQYRHDYGYNRGYNRHAQFDRELQDIRVQMNNLGRSGRLTPNEARDLDNDIRSTQYMIMNASRGGIQPWQARSIEQKMNNLRYELRRYSDNDRRNGWRRHY